MRHASTHLAGLPVLACITLLLSLGGCAVPNALSHSDDYHGKLEDRNTASFTIRHTRVRNLTYLIAGGAAGVLGLSQLPRSEVGAYGQTSSTGNSLYALAGIGLGAYAIYTWIKMEDQPVLFYESGYKRIYSEDGAFIGVAFISGNRITFDSMPPPRVKVMLSDNKTILLDLKGRHYD